MRTGILMLAGSLALAPIIPADAAAQRPRERVRPQQRRAQQDQRAQRHRGSPLEELLFGRHWRDGRRGRAAYCRDGSGHPVWGRRWCRDRRFRHRRGDAFGRHGYDRYDRGRRGRGHRGRGHRYRGIGLLDIILGTDRYRDPYQADVIGILGEILFGRFDTRRRQLGIRGPLHGHWRDGRRGSRLELCADGIPLGAVLDLDGDGRADDVRPYY